MKERAQGEVLGGGGVLGRGAKLLRARVSCRAHGGVLTFISRSHLDPADRRMGTNPSCEGVPSGGEHDDIITCLMQV